MATKRRTPARRTAPKRSAPRRQPSGGGNGVGVRGSASASASASVASGWFAGWFKDFSLIRIGSSGSGGRGGLRRHLGSLVGAVQGARTGSKTSLDGLDGVGCVDCGGQDYHQPGCAQEAVDDYTIDVEVIEPRRAIGPGGTE